MHSPGAKAALSWIWRRVTVARRRKGRRLALSDRAAFLIPSCCSSEQKKAPPQGRGHFLMGWCHFGAVALSSPRQRPQQRPRLVAEQPLRRLLVFADLHGILQQMRHGPGLNIQTLNVEWTALARRAKEKPRRSGAGGRPNQRAACFNRRFRLPGD
jgi:hypothetical protein